MLSGFTGVGVVVGLAVGVDVGDAVGVDVGVAVGVAVGVGCVVGVAVGVAVADAVGAGVGSGVGTGSVHDGSGVGVTSAIGAYGFVVGPGEAGSFVEACRGTVTRTLGDSAPAFLSLPTARIAYRYVLPGETFVSVNELRVVFPRLLPSR
jgi:hypothetical protein